MGLFSRPKCPIHNREYSLSSNGFNDYYYCPRCEEEKRQQKEEKLSLEKRIKLLEKQISKLEKVARIVDIISDIDKPCTEETKIQKKEPTFSESEETIRKFGKFAYLKDLGVPDYLIRDAIRREEERKKLNK